MKSDIQDLCHSCGRCAQFQTQNSKEPMKSQPIPEYPWQFVSQDLCEFESGAYLITTDHFSDFIEVDELDNTLSSTIAQKTEAHITRHGLPEMILSDNGPQFIGTEYKQLCQKIPDPAYNKLTLLATRQRQIRSLSENCQTDPSEIG